MTFTRTRTDCTMTFARGNPMTLLTRYSVHSIARISSGVGWAIMCLFFVPLAVILFYVYMNFYRGNALPFEHVRTILPLFGVLGPIGCTLGLTYPKLLFAAISGLADGVERGFALILFSFLSLNGLLLFSFWVPNPVVPVIGLGLLIPLYVFAVFSMTSWKTTRRVFEDYQYALSPGWPAGSPGVDTQRAGKSVFVRRILIVRGVSDPGLLRLMVRYGSIESFQPVPACGLIGALCAAHPFLRRRLAPLARSEPEPTTPEAIDLAIERWGTRSDRPWQGVLDDATLLVHNDGETRIAPPGKVLFERYRANLREHGPDIGLGKYYVQAGDEVVVESCS